MKDQYSDVKQDLYGAFVVRGIELTHDAGLLAIVIGDTWMAIKSFEALRLRLLSGHAFDSFVHMRDVSNHPDIFGANAAFVLSMAGNRSRHAPFIRLTPLGSDRKEQDLRVALAQRTENTGFHLASGADFASIPGTPIAYWLSENLRQIFAVFDRIGTSFDAIAGISTGNNGQFFRFWHEVSTIRIGGGSESAPWAPHHKGGASRKWAGNVEHVLRYAESSVKQMALLPGFRHDGNAEYFKPHVGWSALTSGQPSFRAIPAGCTFGSGSKALMISGNSALAQIAVLNSTFALSLLRALSPTMNYEVGHILSLPMAPFGADERLSSTVGELIAVSLHDWDSDETSSGFSENPLVARSRADQKRCGVD